MTQARFEPTAIAVMAGSGISTRAKRFDCGLHSGKQASSKPKGVDAEHESPVESSRGTGNFGCHRGFGLDNLAAEVK